MPKQECPFPEFEQGFGLWGMWEGPTRPDRKFWPYADYYEGLVASRKFLFFPHDLNCMGELVVSEDESVVDWHPLPPGALRRHIMGELNRGHDIVSGRTHILGRITFKAWPTGVLMIHKMLGEIFLSTQIDDPVATRLWGDYLLDVETRPYLLDYLTDHSETFAQWMRELPE